MGQVGAPLRLFLFLVAVALPPLVVFAVVGAVAPHWLAGISSGTILLFVAALAVAWAAVLAVIAARGLRSELRAVLSLAEHGSAGERGEGQRAAEGVEPYQRLARALDERNRQVAELAARLRAAPIEEDGRAVARATLASAVQVTSDPTWSLVVLRSPDSALLPTGAYTVDEDEPGPLADIHRWASTAGPDDPAIPGVRHAIGPWGAFVVVEISAGDSLRASLIAPWEGRDVPSRAEREVLSLLGQSSATALEHALLYARLRAQAAELNRLAAIQTDFLRGVTHDLQTPLTSIAALAVELQQRPALAAGERLDLATIEHQAERLRRMVSQLLVASRLEAGAVTPRQEVFQAEPLVERTWKALRSDRPFTIRTIGHPRLVVGDPDRFEQVLWALLDNAVKYSPPGSAIRVEIEGVETTPGVETVLDVRVVDDGAGIEAQDLAHAFDQFYRSEGARRMAPDGSGVGLYAARGLMRAMGGDLELRSSLGVGTEARLWLPAEDAVEERVPTS